MKPIIYFITTLVLMINTACVHSQSKDEQIISMLKEFYIAYNAVWENATSYEPEEFEEKVFSLHQKYCSNKLRSRIKKLYRTYKLEHDLLSNDFGGTDSEKLKESLSIIKDTTNKNGYIISYIIEFEAPEIPREEENIIRLTVVSEGGDYKIDEVW